MKALKTYCMALVLLISATSKALNCPVSENIRKTFGVAMIGAAALHFCTQKKMTEAELETRRSIVDEQDVPTMMYRFSKEEVLGQFGDKEHPASGFVGKTGTIMKEQFLPVLGAISLLEKTKEKLIKGWKTFGLDKIFDITQWISVPTFAPEKNN